MTEQKTLTHVDQNQLPTMVDITAKATTSREASARTVIQFPREILAVLREGEINSPKGPVFTTAIIAGTMAAKKTADLIPFCHPIEISSCKIRVKWISPLACELWCTVKTNGPTGVEMEALTGCTVAALTVYDMCKALSHDIEIASTKLMQKSGGKSDFLRQDSVTL